MKKKIKRQKNGLPLLTDNDFPFAGSGFGEKPSSFDEIFDPSLFDRDVQKLLSSRLPASRPSQKAYPPPQEQLDLHGFTSSVAEVRVASFVLTALGKGLKTVRVITGKGLHSPGKAVLPDVVEVLVQDMKNKGQIHDYGWENGNKSNSGALVLYL